MANFQELINQDTPVLVDFYADWCGPCKMMPPILQEVKEKLGNNIRILKVDVDKNNTAANKFGIKSIPTLLLFKSGKILWRKTGVAEPAEIQQALSHIA